MVGISFIRTMHVADNGPVLAQRVHSAAYQSHCNMQCLMFVSLLKSVLGNRVSVHALPARSLAWLSQLSECLLACHSQRRIGHAGVCSVTQCCILCWCRAAQRYKEVVRPILAAAGLQVLEHTTTHAGHATAIVQELELSGLRAVVMVGGDGTVWEALQVDPLLHSACSLTPCQVFQLRIQGQPAHGNLHAATHAQVEPHKSLDS